MENLKNLEFSKKLLTFLIIVVVILLALQLIKNKKENLYNSYKESPKKEFVYTKYHSDTNNASVPYINLTGENIKKINKEIVENATSYLTSENKDKTVTYRYNQSKNILSLVITYRDVDENDRLIYSYKTYVIDLKADQKVLTNDEIINKFNITYKEINDIMDSQMKEKYKEEIKEKYIEKNECDYSCYLKTRGINSYIENASYYIENSRLVVYRPFDVYSIYGEEDYFTRKDFKFIIK